MGDPSRLATSVGYNKDQDQVVLTPVPCATGPKSSLMNSKASCAGFGIIHARPFLVLGQPFLQGAQRMPKAQLMLCIRPNGTRMVLISDQSLSVSVYSRMTPRPRSTLKKFRKTFSFAPGSA